MKRMPKSKQRILARTVQRRKYNSIVDGNKDIPQSAIQAMQRKPYGFGEKDEEKNGKDERIDSL